MNNNECYLFYLDKRLLLKKNTEIKIGRSPENDIVFHDNTVSRKHSVIQWKAPYFKINDLNSTNGLFINGKKVKSKVLINEDKIRIGKNYLEFVISEEASDKTISPGDTLIIEGKIEQMIDEIKDKDIAEKLIDLKFFMNKRKEELSDLAYKDRLTGLYNRRYLDEVLYKEIERTKRYNHDLSIIMIDIDHFKRVNDKYGHQKGDEVLSNVSMIITESTRINDSVFRYGGEEICVVLPETNISNALIVAEKIRRNVESQSLFMTSLKITISLGVSCFTKERNTAQLIIESSDSALYSAKQNGRNRVGAST